ncbi:cysteine peptidase family C39 domain-containing protein, partial [uncultured Dubosiella sp.]|uniref:cysteine peptidase family C39 domain-containing protein n=1 Tax=uncultured Dubosiella sp. TaxID=1937011 RepID=UPI00266F123D
YQLGDATQVNFANALRGNSLMDAAAQNYGVQVQGVPVDEAAFDQALAEGKILLVSVNPGHFTRVGHFIVIQGMENGQYNVLDPNSNKNTKLWDKSIVLSEAAAAWGYWK